MQKQHPLPWKGKIYWHYTGQVNSVRVIEAHCTPAYNDLYGAGSGGYILVEGEFGPVNRHCFESDHHNYSLRHLFQLSSEDFVLKMCFAKNHDWQVWIQGASKELFRTGMILNKSFAVGGAYERLELHYMRKCCFKRCRKSVIRVV